MLVYPKVVMNSKVDLTELLLFAARSKTALSTLSNSVLSIIHQPFNIIIEFGVVILKIYGIFKVFLESD